MVMADRQKAPIRVGFYDIERTIGKGNFAVVKLARHRITKTELRLGLVKSAPCSTPDYKRFNPGRARSTSVAPREG
uniref:Protein kinase domain-containing protein n=1 Tax=Timema cristinae TaxID=61476 RepID=A0A7R9CDD7_TIMCR|nr:unnamed protein product [Timema cristinae]